MPWWTSEYAAHFELPLRLSEPSSLWWMIDLVAGITATWVSLDDK
jgi:hypothetical protein